MGSKVLKVGFTLCSGQIQPDLQRGYKYVKKKEDKERSQRKSLSSCNSTFSFLNDLLGWFIFIILPFVRTKKFMLPFRQRGDT